jgi:hypothetical protein
VLPLEDLKSAIGMLGSDGGSRRGEDHLEHR